MKGKTFWWAARIVVAVLAVSMGAAAQSWTQVRFSGLISDYTLAGSDGPWEVRGEWSLRVDGESGEANFSAALAMVRSDEGVLLHGNNFNDQTQRSPHTHHITLVNGTVTPIANGFRVSGPITITANGKFPPPFGPSSTLQIDIVGNNSVPFSNIKLTFGGDAANHFGSQTVNGVVRSFK